MVTVWDAKINSILSCVDSFAHNHGQGMPESAPSDCADMIRSDEQFSSTILCEAASKLRKSSSLPQPYASQVADAIV